MTISIIPINYKRIDKYLSRSAQITDENIRWLKTDGVTDIINLRTMTAPEIKFDEKNAIESYGLVYHNIPTNTLYPSEENVGKFLDIMENIKKSGGRAHIHCKRGSDRTGMYSYIYERLNNIQTPFDNYKELVRHGWHFDRYPNIAIWAENFVTKLLKK